MIQPLSANTQAILMLTAPLITGRDGPRAQTLTPGEYKRLAQRLRDIRRQPADMIGPAAAA
jgi:DNA processing protein